MPVVAIGILILALFAACGGGSEGPDDADQTQPMRRDEPAPVGPDTTAAQGDATVDATGTPRPVDQAPEIGAAQAGSPGSIRGVVKSPYLRVAHAVVFIDQVKGRQFAPPDDKPVIGQRDKIFKPHLLPLVVGTTVDFTNDDDVKHNVYSREGSASQFNLGEYEPGVARYVTFNTVGTTHLGCRVHTEMSGYVVALQNPYFALTERDGSFAISDVPPGRYRLTFFHEKIKEKAIEVTVEPTREAVVEFSGLSRK